VDDRCRARQSSPHPAPFPQIGAADTLLTVIVIMLLGNPSSGGATGVPYLPTFWRDIGPFLHPERPTSCYTTRSTHSTSDAVRPPTARSVESRNCPRVPLACH